MKAKLYEIVIFYFVVAVFAQIPAISFHNVFPNFTGWPYAIVQGIIFATMCHYGRKYVWRKFKKYW